MTSRALHIVHVVSSLAVGGMERFVLRLAGEQQRNGYEVKVIALRGGPLLAEARDEQIPVLVAEGRRMTRIFAMLREVAASQPDVVHAHNPTCLHYAVAGKLTSRARLVMTDHAQGHGLIRMPSRFERRCVDAVVAVSRHTALHPIAPDLGPKTTVIHNGVQASSFTRDEISSERPPGLKGRFVGVMPASLKPVKGHRVLLESIAMLKEQGVPLTILLAGEGPELAALKTLAHTLHLTDLDVQFMGFRSDVGRWLALADFMVLPSLSEGLPLSILEAMIVGTPVVATEVGGIPEVIIDGESGRLVPPADPVRLAEAIRDLYASPEKRRAMARKGQRVAALNFSFEVMERRYDALYRELLGAR